jgi:hypothetical protein
MCVNIFINIPRKVCQMLSNATQRRRGELRASADDLWKALIQGMWQTGPSAVSEARDRSPHVLKQSKFVCHNRQFDSDISGRTPSAVHPCWLSHVSIVSVWNSKHENRRRVGTHGGGRGKAVAVILPVRIPGAGNDRRFSATNTCCQESHGICDR